MPTLFGLGHVTQLHEIQKARLKRGQPGIGAEVEEFISRLTSGVVAGKSADPREIHAKRLWDLGVGRELGFKDFGVWLESLPPIPKRPDDNQLSTLVLVPDQSKIGIMKSCQLLGISFSDADNIFVDAWPDRAISGTYWMWCQDGSKYRGKKPVICRDDLFPKKNLIAMTAHEGLWLYVVDRSVLRCHCIDLPGSVRGGRRGHIAYLLFSGNGPRLYWRWGDAAGDDYGSASRGIVST